MNYRKCRCLKFEASEQEVVYVKLEPLYEKVLLEMFPNNEVVEQVPNIWYEVQKDSVNYYWDIDENWSSCDKHIFDIAFMIEDYVMYRCDKLVLHGGALACDGKAILFTQSRKSGKSTLLRALLSTEEYEYISDDLLLYDNEQVAGLAMPIRVRNKLESVISVNGKYIGEMIDETGEMRYIFLPHNSVRVGYTKIIAIVLPQYIPDGENQINELKGFQKVTRLLPNIKEYKNMKDLYIEMVEMTKGTSVYSLQYHDIEYAKKEIQKLWSK